MSWKPCTRESRYLVHSELNHELLSQTIYLGGAFDNKIHLLRLFADPMHPTESERVLFDLEHDFEYPSQEELDGHALRRSKMV